MAGNDPLGALAGELGRALQPLVDAASSPAALHDLIADIGWELNPLPPAVQALKAPAEQVYNLVEGSDELDTADVAALIDGLRAAFKAISDISAAGGGGIPPGFGATFPRELADYLVVEYLLNQQPRWGELLRTLGVIRLDPVAAAGGRPAHVKRVVAYEALGRLVDEPLALLHDTYRWAQPDFRGEVLLENASAMLRSWGLEMVDGFLDTVTAGQINTGAISALSDTAKNLVLLHSESSVPMELGLALSLLPETATSNAGFAVLPYGSADFEQDIELSDMATLKVDGTAKLTDGPGVLVRPDGVSFKTGFGSAGSPGGASGTLTLALVVGETGEPMILLGAPGASRFELGSVSTLAGTRFHSNGEFELFAEFAVQDARIVIKPGDGQADGFLSSLLPADGLAIETDLTVGFSTTQGLYFAGSGGLEIAIPAHIQLGPVEILGALIGVRFADGIAVDLAASLKADLSVLTATVENVGVTALFTFPADGKGNLGPVNLEMRFKAPNGVGLTVDAGVVKGGGYLYLNHAAGEYAGALELTVSNLLSLKAIGLINTKLPGGQPGFSLLAIITAEFNPGFQLGFGFTLLGVGGLIGLNRGMLLEPLAGAVRSGAVNNILFPTNVVENAPRILSDLRAIFPPREGVFLIGPMAKIGWGTPTLISVSLGVIIEIPGNIVILGRLRVALPTEEAAVVVLQVSFMGALELDKKRIWFFATLFESRILFITLDGEMGLLMDFGDNPNFVLSVGGFHPRFAPPPLPFPTPNRVALSLINESFARVRVEAYFAVTSNSVQAGARADAFFGFSALSVEGYFGFDALLRFSPLYLIVEISCGFSVKVFGMGVWGVHLRGSLEGPTPWHVTGAASIEFLFFSISVDVDVTFGERRLDSVPPLPVLPSLKKELEKLDTWRAALPASARLLVSLRELGDPALLVLHPVGTLTVSQRFLPLNMPIDKVGTQKSSDIKKATVSVAPGGLAVRQPARERFAIAQYKDMDDAAKLSAPAFEMLESGVELGAAGNTWATGPSAERTVRYEQILVDRAFERVPKRFFVFWPKLFTHFQRGSAVSRCALSKAMEDRARPFAEKVTIKADQFAVANLADNTTLPGAAVFGSHAEAVAHLQTTVRSNPKMAGSIHVIPSVEVNAAA